MRLPFSVSQQCGLEAGPGSSCSGDGHRPCAPSQTGLALVANLMDPRVHGLQWLQAYWYCHKKPAGMASRLEDASNCLLLIILSAYCRKWLYTAMTRLVPTFAV